MHACKHTLLEHKTSTVYFARMNIPIICVLIKTAPEE